MIAVALLAGCGGDSKSSAPACELTASDSGSAKEITPVEPGKRYTIEFQTTHGSFTVEIDEETAPCNGASMLQLARDGFFDGIAFHRIVPGFVIQAGQSRKTPDGGPGYTTVDRPAPDTKYVKGTVAMAKTAVEPVGTGGSQFFVVTGPNVTLPPDYAVIGKVVKGLAVVEKIGRLGNVQTETPTARVVIERAKVSGL